VSESFETAEKLSEGKKSRKSKVHIPANVVGRIGVPNA